MRKHEKTPTPDRWPTCPDCGGLLAPDYVEDIEVALDSVREAARQAFYEHVDTGGDPEDFIYVLEPPILLPDGRLMQALAGPPTGPSGRQ